MVALKIHRNIKKLIERLRPKVNAPKMGQNAKCQVKFFIVAAGHHRVDSAAMDVAPPITAGWKFRRRYRSRESPAAHRREAHRTNKNMQPSRRCPKRSSGRFGL